MVLQYQAETSPSQIRGLVNGMYQFFVTFGILMACMSLPQSSLCFADLFADCIAIGSRELENSGQWRLVNGLGFTWPTILAIFIQTMPESPRWLAARGRDEEARRAIARVRGVTGSSSIFSKKSSKVEDDLKTRWDGLIDRELDEMHNTIKYESQSANGTWLDCFKPKDKVLYRTLLGAFCFGFYIFVCY